MAKNDQPGLSDLPSMRKFVPNRRDESDQFSTGKRLPVMGTQAVQNFGNAGEQGSPWQGRPVTASATRTTTAMSGVKPEPQPSLNIIPGVVINSPR